MTTQEANYFILHGSFASPFSNWVPWLQKEISNRGLSVYTPDLPSGVGYQNYENWNRLMEAYVSAGLIGEHTTIFAHSIAPIFVCKFLVEHNLKVRRLVFVCGVNNYLGINSDYDAVNKSMYSDNLADVKSLCSEIICYYSDDDPYVKMRSKKILPTLLPPNRL